MDSPGHSELYFSAYRNHWYNRDFLDLMARRWQLHSYSSLLDVGSGLCHWSRMLVPYLSKNSVVTAYDNDVKWAERNEELERYFNAFQSTLNFVKGDAHELPFENNSFDVVTCQTLLIHLKDPRQALLEMKRVVKENGIVICAEPNNLATVLIKDSSSKGRTTQEWLDKVKFEILWEQGKIKINEGDNSFGDLLTGTMNELGYKNLRTYLSDKTLPLIPPYSDEEQRDTIESMQLWDTESKTLEDTERRYFEALGSEALQYYENFQQKDNDKRILKQIKENRYYSGGAAIMYLVSGNK